MNQKYRLAEIRMALEIFEEKHPKEESMTLEQLRKLIALVRKPPIYNIDEIIELLTLYINENKDTAHLYHSESRVCKILKVKKLAMHNWRKKKYIDKCNTGDRTVYYDLHDLLAKLNQIKCHKHINQYF